jgi:hypothetical protein
LLLYFDELLLAPAPAATPLRGAIATHFAYVDRATQAFMKPFSNFGQSSWPLGQLHRRGPRHARYLVALATNCIDVALATHTIFLARASTHWSDEIREAPLQKQLRLICDTSSLHVELLTPTSTTLILFLGSSTTTSSRIFFGTSL